MMESTSDVGRTGASIHQQGGDDAIVASVLWVVIIGETVCLGIMILAMIIGGYLMRRQLLDLIGDQRTHEAQMGDRYADVVEDQGSKLGEITGALTLLANSLSGQQDEIAAALSQLGRVVGGVLEAIRGGEHAAADDVKSGLADIASKLDEVLSRLPLLPPPGGS